MLPVNTNFSQSSSSEKNILFLIIRLQNSWNYIRKYKLFHLQNSHLFSGVKFSFLFSFNLVALNLGNQEFIGDEPLFGN